jgi:NADP-reducing hydrogenase subunit HndD
MDDISFIKEVLADESKTVVAQTAPSVRVTVCEEFGSNPCCEETGRVVAALRKLGFDYVFDTDLGADVTVVEESAELVRRLKNNGALPQFTSCCPGWTRFCLKTFPELGEHLSDTKSPQQIVGALTKTYFAEKTGKKPEEIFVVGVMPCYSKKLESKERETEIEGVKQEVDFILTTKDFAKFIKQEGIEYSSLEPSAFDEPLGITSGASNLFAGTGGVMESVVRAAHYKMTGEELAPFVNDRRPGFGGTKEFSVDAGLESPLRVAIVNGYGEARGMCERVLNEKKNGKRSLDFIEVLACRGGCVGGPGQPSINAEAVERRATGLRALDSNNEIRNAHENPDVKKLYSEYLGEEGGVKAHRFLHRKGTGGILETLK